MKRFGIVPLIFYGLLSLIVFGLANQALADETKEKKEAAQASEPESKPPPKATISTLATITQSANDLREQMEDKKKKLAGAKTEEDQSTLQKEIDELNSKLGSFANDFEKIATGVDLESFEEKHEEEFDWRKEMQSILGPIVHQVRGMTERPRQIEKLRMQLAHFERRLVPVKQAVDNIEALVAHADHEAFKQQLGAKLLARATETLQKQLTDAHTKRAEQKLRKQLTALYEKEITATLNKEEQEAKRKVLEKVLREAAPKKIEEEVKKQVEDQKFVEERDQLVAQALEKKLADPKLKKSLAQTLELELRTLQKSLKTLETNWKNEEQQISSQHVVTQYQLTEKLKQKTSFFQSVQNILRIFFKSRGRNLLFAFLAFFGVWLLFRLFYRLVYRLSPIHGRRSRSFYIRLGDITYQFITVIGATGAFLATLYITGDWVLLILTLIFLLGIAWTAKHGIPIFWEQIKLLLNLSTVRENERVVYSGIPWKVVTLNIYSELENPALKSGRIRLPLRDLIDLRSRPFNKDEPWFPCQEKDWVLFDNGDLRRVISQSPEMVEVIALGGARTTYPTQDFLAATPKNLSRNFRLKTIFGVDYDHQPICTTKIPEKLKTALVDGLDEAGYGDKLKELKVEFKSAGASSLDYEVLADFDGSAARYHNRLGRALQRICVDACNEHGWVIPFTQITLHTVDTDSAQTA